MGPSLQLLSGVSGVLADPELEVRNRNGELVAANDDWQTNAEQFTGSTALVLLRPIDQREAALRVSLPAGAYTVLVRGDANSTGIALIEFYDLRR